MKKFKSFLTEMSARILKMDNQPVTLSKDAPAETKDALIKAGFIVGDPFTIYQGHTGTTKDIKIGNTGKEEVVLKDLNGDFIRLMGTQYDLRKTFDIAPGGPAKFVKEMGTHKQEEASLYLFEEAIENGYSPTDDEIKSRYPKMSPAWLHAFRAQAAILKQHLGKYSFKHYERGGEFTKFIRGIVGNKKLLGYKKIDAWNPADVWLLKDKWSPSSEIGVALKSAETIQRVNFIMRDAYAKQEIIGISLKKVGPKVKIANWSPTNTSRNMKVYNYPWKSGYLNLKLRSNGAAFETQNVDWYMVPGITSNSTTGKGNIGIEYKNSSSAKWGMASRDLVQRLFQSLNRYFPAREKSKAPGQPHDVPLDLEEFQKQRKEYRYMIAQIAKSKLNFNLGGVSVDEAIDNIITVFKSDNKTYAKKATISKLQAILLAYQLVLVERTKGRKGLDQLVTEIGMLCQKSGADAGPFVKVS